MNMRAMYIQRSVDVVMGMRKTADAGMSISMRNMHMSRESAGWKIMHLTM